MNNSDDKRDRVMKAALDCRTELIAYARSRLGNYAAADDVLQEALLVVFKKFDQFQEGTSMLAWCRSIVRIEVLRAKQRHHRERSLVERLLDDAVDAAFDEFQTKRRHDDVESWREALTASFTLSGSSAQASSRSLSRSSSPNSALDCASRCFKSGVFCGAEVTGSNPVSPTPIPQQGSRLITPDQVSPSFIGSSAG